MYAQHKIICSLKMSQPGCRHSSGDSSVPTILSPRVRVPNTPSTLSSIIVFVQYLSCGIDENKQERPVLARFYKKIYQHGLFLVIFNGNFTEKLFILKCVSKNHHLSLKLRTYLSHINFFFAPSNKKMFLPIT